MRAVCIYFREGKKLIQATEINKLLNAEGCSSVVEEIHDYLDIRYLSPFSALFSQSSKYISALKAFALKHSYRSLITNFEEDSSDIVFAADCRSAAIMSALIKKSELSVPVILFSSDKSPVPEAETVQLKNPSDIDQAFRCSDKREKVFVISSMKMIGSIISALSSR